MRQKRSSNLNPGVTDWKVQLYVLVNEPNVPGLILIQNIFSFTYIWDCLYKKESDLKLGYYIPPCY